MYLLSISTNLPMTSNLIFLESWKQDIIHNIGSKRYNMHNRLSVYRIHSPSRMKDQFLENGSQILAMWTRDGKNGSWQETQWHIQQCPMGSLLFVLVCNNSSKKKSTSFPPFCVRSTHWKSLSLLLCSTIKPVRNVRFNGSWHICSAAQVFPSINSFSMICMALWVKIIPWRDVEVTDFSDYFFPDMTTWC